MATGDCIGAARRFWRRGADVTDLGAGIGKATATRVRSAACAALALVAVLVACNSTTNGTATPAAGPVSTPTTSTPSAVPAAGVKGKLLPLPQLAEIMGDTDMKPLRSYAEPDSKPGGIEPFDCISVALAAAANAYFIPARQSLTGDVDRGAGGAAAGQVLAVFASRTDANEFLDAVTNEWGRCVHAGGYTLTGDKPQRWGVGAVERSSSRVAITATRRDDPPRACRHVVAVQANLTAESIACGAGDTVGQATRIVDALLAKFPT